MMDQFLWVLFPISFCNLYRWTYFRYNYDQFGWTSKSSELLERKCSESEVYYSTLGLCS